MHYIRATLPDIKQRITSQLQKHNAELHRKFDIVCYNERNGEFEFLFLEKAWILELSVDLCVEQELAFAPKNDHGPAQSHKSI